MKKIMCLICICSLLLAIPVFADNGTVSVSTGENTMQLSFDQDNLYGASYVPLEELCKLLDVSCKESKGVYILEKSGNRLEVKPNVLNCTFNGKKQLLEKPFYVKNNNLLAPLRFMVTFSGHSFNYNAKQKTASIVPLKGKIQLPMLTLNNPEFQLSYSGKWSFYRTGMFSYIRNEATQEIQLLAVGSLEQGDWVSSDVLAIKIMNREMAILDIPTNKALVKDKNILEFKSDYLNQKVYFRTLDTCSVYDLKLNKATVISEDDYELIPQYDVSPLGKYDFYFDFDEMTLYGRVGSQKKPFLISKNISYAEWSAYNTILYVKSDEKGDTAIWEYNFETKIHKIVL